MNRYLFRTHSHALPAYHKGGTVLGILVGLVLGALVVAVGAWYLTRQPPAFQQNDRGQGQSRLPTLQEDPIALPGRSGGKPLTAPETSPLPPVEDNAVKTVPEPTPTAKSTNTPAPGNTQVAKLDPQANQPKQPKQPKGFYEILQKGADAPAPSPYTETPAAEKNFYLQVGAFENPTEADNLKAKLALNGINATTQRVEIVDKPTVLRVRVGPYAKPEDASDVRARLQTLGINANIVKNK